MSEELIAGFVAGPADVAAASALAGMPEAELLRLVERLAAEARRGHLEALGEARLPRQVRKTARKAAYKLKSAGIGGVAAGRTGKVELPEEAIDPERAVMTIPPGLYGRFFFLLGSIEGAHAVELRTGPLAELEGIERLPPTSTARLVRLVDKVGDAETQGMPFLCGLDLAARLLDGLSEEIRREGGRFPQEWTDVVQWRHAAAQLQADPERASARRGLAGRLRSADEGLDATAELVTARLAGPALPPAEVLAELGDEATVAARDRVKHDEEGWKSVLHEMADRHCDRWLGHKGVRERLQRLLELTADTAWVRGDEQTALGLLQVVDALGRGTRGSRVGYLRRTFRRLVDEGALTPPAPAAEAT